MNEKIQILAVRIVLRRKAFLTGWYRYNKALRLNAGDWPTYYEAARTVAAVTNTCEFNKSIAGRSSSYAWDKAMKAEFPWAYIPRGYIQIGDRC